MSALPKLPMPSRFKRVQQWQLFMRYWHVIDANFQDINLLGNKVGAHLVGRHKLFWHQETDCGDHVVVVNCRDVAMHGFDWKHTLFHFDRRYPRSKRNLEAFRIHEYDPCRVLWMVTSYAIRQWYPNNVPRRKALQRLHLFPDDELPEFILKNIGNQLEQIQPVPKKSTDYTAEERESFPRLKRWPDDHLIDWHKPSEPEFTYAGAEIEKRIIEKQPH